MPHILDGTIHPGRVFDRTVALEDVAEGYRLMNEREALKVIVRPDPHAGLATSTTSSPKEEEVP